MSVRDWVLASAAGVGVFLIVEAEKTIVRWRAARRGARG
jgi:hypothetical protein